MARRRKLEFDLSIRKYLRSAFDELKSREENKYKTNDEIYDTLDEKQKGEVSTHIISWLFPDEDLRKLFQDIINALKPQIEEYNKQIMTKYNLSQYTLSNIYKYYINIISKYLVPIKGPYNFMNDIYQLVFKNKDELKQYLNELINFKKIMLTIWFLYLD